MKQKLFSLLLAVAASVGTMSAQGTKIGNLYYDLNATNKTAEVTFGDYSGLTTANIPASVRYSGTTYSVTSIGGDAFVDCSSLTSVTIPNSVTSIEYEAFWGCSSLTSVTIGNSVTSIGDWAFRGCSGLTSVTIPNSVTSIGSSAFAFCSGLTSVTIGNSVTSIEFGAFSGCSSLTSVTIPNSVTNIGYEAFSGCSGLTSVTIGNSVTSIDDQAFYGCSSLTSVTLNSNTIVGKNLKSIFGEQVTEYILGDEITSIGSSAFSGCSSLTSVTIPNSVTSIGSSAFYGCSSLTSVTIPNSVTSIGREAFNGCSGLTSVTIPNSVTSIREYAFSNCSSLTSVTIPNGVTSIGEKAFSNCSSLTSVTIPNSVTSIGDQAFEICSGLTSVTIGNSVTSIGNSAFFECISLTSVTIPNSVTSIEVQAFDGCSSLTAIYVPCGEMARFKQMLGGSNKVKYAPLPYTITINAEYGNVTYPQTMCDDMSLNATPEYGYHFVKWSDGVTDNPRAIELTRDITLTAEFAKNTYTISTTSANPEWGTTAGGSALYLDEVEISATPNYGYHFVQWSDREYICDDWWDGVCYYGHWGDYNTEPTRTIVVEHDSVITATFAKNVYTITKNAAHGTISGNSSAEYLDYVTLTVTPDYGYHFTQWSDGNTDNPRTFVLTQDTTFTAEFARNTVITYIYDSHMGYVSGPTTAASVGAESITFEAIPNYGYHFSQWSDGVTDNPRTIVLTQDTTFTAEFAINNYTIETQSSLPESGIILGGGTYEYLSQQTVTAIPNYGYHFVKWVIDDNTGAISVARAYAIASALGAGETTTTQYTIYGYVTGTYGSYYNSYYLSDSPDVPGNFIAFKCVSSADIGQYVKVTGYLTNYKGNTPETTSGASITPNDLSPLANPCTFTLKNNISFVAEFAKNVYTISLNNAEHGTISGNTSAEYLDEVILTANPERYYHFAQWSDGNKENPRTIVMTQDTAFAAEFAVDKSGVCGDDNLLTWTFDDESKTLAISGEGTLNSNYTFGVEAPTQTERLIIAEGVTSVGNNAFNDMSSTITSLALPSTVTEIGDYAFAGMNNRKFNTLVLPNTIIHIGAHAFDGASYLQTIHFGSTLEEIGDYAFNGCTRVKQMTCLAEITPNVGTDGLTSINSLAELYVPNEYLFDYQIDSNWSRFVLKPYGATETTVTDNDVAVVADDNTATFTWPTSNTADSYTIDITKDGVLFCQLTFNANGQLTGIAFAPGRNGQSMAPAATLTTSGMQFTVTGLNSGTNYAFNLTVKSGSTVVASYTGAFATTGGVPTSTDVLQSDHAPRKFMRDNQVLIMRGGKTYTIQGVEVK